MKLILGLTNSVLFLAGVTSHAMAQDYIAPAMVNIPAGKFMMGAEGGDPATLPIHPVSVDAFQMGKYAITVAEFRKFAQDTGFSRESTCNDYIDNQGLRGPTHKGSGRWDNNRYTYSDYQPVTCISWQDANAYAAWLSKKTGIGYRLPTEQEWEYAAKANTTTRYFWGDDPTLTQACKYGNFADFTGEYTNNQKYGLSNRGWIEHVNCDDGEPYVAIVGLYRPNPFGLYDMLGNVSEFVDGCYSETGYKIDLLTKEDANQCEYLPHRGGNWHYPADPATTRDRWKREGWNVGTGRTFRLVIDGHEVSNHSSTSQFEGALKKAQVNRIQTREKLLLAPQNAQVVKDQSRGYTLTWTPSNDSRVVGYDIYRSKTHMSHFYGGYYDAHYEKIKTVPANKFSARVSLPSEGGSFRVVALANKQQSLPSRKAIVFVEPDAVALPSKFDMRYATRLDNVTMRYFSATDKLPEAYNIFKTNKDSDKSEVSINFKVDVESSGWYQLNYSGRTFHKGEFFKVWQGDKLLAVIDHDPDVDDKVSDRHKVFIDKGTHQLQLTVMRTKFDMWGLGWLKFSKLSDTVN